MKLIALALLALVASAVSAQEPVSKKGYVTKQGVYVPPSYTTAPNDTKLDNYSTKGNVNPYTGKAGTVDPYKIEPAKAPRAPKSK